MSDVVIEPWDEGNLALLEQLNAPEMTAHLSGPEKPEKLADRQRRYELADSGMFKIMVAGQAVGSVGYWEREWRDAQVYELGWSVVPAFQGRGIAGKATELVVARARAERKHRFAHAFPAVDNGPSNAICSKRFDDDGNLFVVDRLKELIKVRGYHVAPAQLEAELAAHPAVADAAVVPRPDEESGEVPVAHVELRGAAEPAELAAWVAERVAPYKRLADVIVVDALPRAPSGKLLRRVLVEHERAAPVA